MMRQIDLFSAGQRAKAIPQTPDPDEIRGRLDTALQQLRKAGQMPWTPSQLRSWKHVFQNMANWLPQDEGSKLRQDFWMEIERLERR